jgi:hypothetical protein
MYVIDPNTGVKHEIVYVQSNAVGEQSQWVSTNQYPSSVEWRQVDSQTIIITFINVESIELDTALVDDVGGQLADGISCSNWDSIRVYDSGETFLQFELKYHADLSENDFACVEKAIKAIKIQ